MLIWERYPKCLQPCIWVKGGYRLSLSYTKVTPSLRDLVGKQGMWCCRLGGGSGGVGEVGHRSVPLVTGEVSSWSKPLDTGKPLVTH